MEIKVRLLCTNAWNAHVIENYQAILILDNFAEMFKPGVITLLIPQVEPFVVSNQHGFFNNRPTISNVAVLNRTLCSLIDQWQQVDDHRIFLYRSGLRNSLLFLFSLYLKNRKQYIACNGLKSFVYLKIFEVQFELGSTNFFNDH